MKKEDAALLNNKSVDLYIEGQLSATTTTGIDGAFSFSIPYGAKYKLEVKSSDYYSESIDGVVTGRATRIIALTAN